jgi:hypothetical protein
MIDVHRSAGPVVSKVFANNTEIHFKVAMTPTRRETMYTGHKVVAHGTIQKRRPQAKNHSPTSHPNQTKNTF